MTATLDKSPLAVLGHELRNPLAGALAGLAVVAEMTEDGDPRRAILARCGDDLNRVARLLSSYLALGSPVAVRWGRTDLARVVAQVAHRSSVVTVRVTAPPEPLLVRGDPLLLERVLENLVENAVAAGATRVDVDLAVAAGHCEMQVRDDGSGVPADLCERLFEPCVSGRGGHGLGLWIVHEIVASHGGSIELVPVERGAAFRMWLPACE